MGGTNKKRTTNGAASDSAIDSVMIENKPKDAMGLGEGAYNSLIQLAYGANKSVAELADFFGTDIINYALERVGVDARIPSAKGALDQYAGQSDLEEGLYKDSLTAGGELGLMGLGMSGLLKQGGKQLAPMMAGESALTGSLRQMTDVTPKMMAGETGLGVTGGMGGEVGKEYGGATGEVIGNIAGTVGGATVKPLVTRGLKNLDNVLRMQPDPSQAMAIEQAEEIIQQMSVRSGLTPDEIIAKYNQLGEKGTLADVDPVFAQAVRTITNENDTLQGSVTRQYRDRQIDSGERVEKAFNSSLKTEGRDVDSELNKYDEILQPKIKEKYAEASKQPLSLSPKLQNMIEKPKGFFKKAASDAANRLETRRANGDVITHFDIIDEHKKALDNMIGEAIRQGRNEDARLLMQSKHALIDEVDVAIPAYKEARQLYAGRASNESAALLGENFLKTRPRDIEADLKRMSPLEKQFYRLGAKRALEDKVSDLNITRDAMSAIFGKKGSINKLRVLFDDDKSFNAFRDQMQREADFSLTKRIVEGNSSTVRQLKQDEAMSKRLTQVATDLRSSNLEKGNQFLSIITDMSKPDDIKIFEQAKRKAGEFLTNENVDPKKIEALMQAGREKELMKLLEKTARKAHRLSSVVTTNQAAQAVKETSDSTDNNKRVK